MIKINSKSRLDKRVFIKAFIVCLFFVLVLMDSSALYAEALVLYTPIPLSDEEIKDVLGSTSFVFSSTEGLKEDSFKQALVESKEKIEPVEIDKKSIEKEPAPELEGDPELFDEIVEPLPYAPESPELLPYEPEPMTPEEAARLGLVLPTKEDSEELIPFTPELEPLPLDEKGQLDEKDLEASNEMAMEYAKTFWDEGEKEAKQNRLNISGHKTFEVKKADVKGDIGHFSTEQFDSYPGFKMDQSLHLEIDGHINENSTVHAVLDDKDDEDRKFTVDINTPKWRFTLGDFQLKLDGTELTLFTKEVRGIIAAGSFKKGMRSTFLFAQSKGLARREQFRGAGSQQEYRMQAFPIIQNSEQIRIDGRLMQRNADYLIDFEEGIIKFSSSVLPIEVTSWIVVEYEVADENMAYSRNIFGVRQEFLKDNGNRVGLTWLREIDSKTPKAGADVGDELATASTALITPMQHDIYGGDFEWRAGKILTFKGETAVSNLDPNINSDETDSDRAIKGYATKLGFDANSRKVDADGTYYNIDNKFKLIGRDDGVIELGERGLVNDVVSGRGKVSYKLNPELSLFVDGESAETNKENDPDLSKIDFKEFNTGFVWSPNKQARLEFKTGSQKDKETSKDLFSDKTKDNAYAIYDREIGKTKTQTKVEKTKYGDRLNLASGSEILQMNFNLSSRIDESLDLTLSASKIELEDGYVSKGLRSDTRNYSVDLNYEPSSIFNLRGLFQWRREDDMYVNSRSESEIMDSQMRYEPNRNLKTQLKYKVENTSKIIRDDSLDYTKYEIPSSLPTDMQDEMQVLSRFENPVQKSTINISTDYRINEKLQAYVDWKRRDIEDRFTNKMISKTDRKTYELRFTPIEEMIVTTEYEEGFSWDKNSGMDITDRLRLIQLRHELKKDYILDLTYEERDELDKIDKVNDIFSNSKIVSFQRIFNPRVNLEVGVQYDKIDDKDPSKEFEKNLALTLTPYTRNQRYKFFIKHRDIKSTINGKYYEGGVNLSQFIGTDTIIDGEIKRVHSSKLPSGDGYDATVINAQMIITF